MLGRLRLRDMRLTRAEKAEEMAMPAEELDYPYGLRLSLDEDALGKLGIMLPAVGDSFFVVAVAKVRSVSEHESEERKTQHVDLQIEQLSLDAEVVKS